MKALISAYACEPHKGSEPEVGWRSVIQYASNCSELVVVTRANNKDSIESSAEYSSLTNVIFEYYDLPDIFLKIKRGARGAFLYAYFWECFLFFYLLSRYKKQHFDLVQRVTFVSYRLPSFIFYFGKSFIFGPIAGGERFPIDFIRIFSFRGRVLEIARLVFQRFALLDPLVLISMFKADQIIAVTHDTKAILPSWAQRKTSVQPAISIKFSDFNIVKKEPARARNTPIRLLYVGRLLEWKGLMLALLSLRNISGKLDYEFNVIGEGRDRAMFEDFVKKNKLNVNFLGEINRSALSSFYSSHDLFIFPSLHDSGGMVVLEAKAHGLKVLVSDFGGPKMFVDENDFIIKSRNVKDFLAEVDEALSSL